MKLKKHLKNEMLFAVWTGLRKTLNSLIINIINFLNIIFKHKKLFPKTPLNYLKNN